jgi:hypothetical protein
MGIGVGIVSVKLVAMMAVLVVSVSLLTPAISAADPVAGERLCNHYVDGTELNCFIVPSLQYVRAVGPEAYFYSDGSTITPTNTPNSWTTWKIDSNAWGWRQISGIPSGTNASKHRKTSGRRCGSYYPQGMNGVWAHNCADAKLAPNLVYLARWGRILEVPFRCNYNADNQVIACNAPHGCLYVIGASKHQFSSIVFNDDGKTYASKPYSSCTRISFS